MMISAVVNETINYHSNRKLLAVFSCQLCFVDITEASPGKFSEELGQQRFILA